MAWIPAVIASQNENYNNRKKGIIIALIILVLLSIMILISQFGIFNWFANFRISAIFGSIIVFFIVFIVVLAFSVRSERFNRRPYPYQYNNQMHQVINKKVENEIRYEENESDPYKAESFIRNKVKARYCSYCGSYLSPDAVYCPDCGKKIEKIE
jgi:predicted nucleic acid-binding Zn ribbon protein